MPISTPICVTISSTPPTTATTTPPSAGQPLTPWATRSATCGLGMSTSMTLILSELSGTNLA